MMKILLPVDPQEPADAPIELAVQAARRMGAEVHLLGVASPDRAQEHKQDTPLGPDGEPPPAGDPYGNSQIILEHMSQAQLPITTLYETRDQALAALRSRVTEEIEGIASRVRGVQLHITVLMKPHASAAVADYVAEHGIDLVVMRSHGKGRFSSALMGSVSEAVVRTVNVPVLLAGPAYVRAADVEYNDLAVWVDGSVVAEEMLRVAEWVQNLSMHVTVVSAIKSGQKTAEAAEREQYVAGLSAGLGARGVDASWALAPGHDPTRAIVEYIAARPASLPALITHARSGLPRLILGSVAMSVVQSSPSPVLVMHARPSAARVGPAGRGAVEQRP